MEMNNQGMDKEKNCNCPHHKVKPIATILIGIVFILAGFSVITFATSVILLGILAIVIGGAKLGGYNCKCC